METAKEKRKSVPWWVSIIAATLTYCLLKYILPNLNPGHQGLSNFFQLGPTIAPVATIPLLLLAAKQLYDNTTPETEETTVEPKGDEEASADDETTRS